MINKTSLKFIAGFVAIIGISLASLYVLQTYFSPEKQAERRLADLERLYEEDTYGGQTPEETLELLIAALGAGGIPSLFSTVGFIWGRGHFFNKRQC